METSTSLLDRLRQFPDEDSWRRLNDLYRPLIFRWLHRDTSLREDAEDLAQEILGVVCRELPGFERQRTGSFRKWLRTITVYRLQGYYRKRQAQPRADDGGLADLADDRSELALRWDQEHNEHVVRKLLEQVAAEFSEAHVRAFRRHVLEQQGAAEVAAELGLTVNAVWLAKSRILQRLRQLGEGLLD